jgi:protein-S-isoprenylcysteine O-methyltransferase Ste14
MDLTMDIAVSVVSLAIFAQHVWALRGHFVSKNINRGAMGIAIMANVCALIYLVLLWTLPQPVLAQGVGIVIELGSLVLFWAAVRASRAARLRYVFDEGAPATLVTSGPYGLVRHPFYTSYILYWIGWAIALWTPWALLPLVVVVIAYTVAARFEERLFSRTEMAADYVAYRQRTGLFWPRLVR